MEHPIPWSFSLLKGSSSALRSLTGTFLIVLSVSCNSSEDSSKQSQDANPTNTDRPIRVEVTTVFHPSANELPEGLAVHDGKAYVGFAFTGEVVRIDLATGNRVSFGRVNMPPPLPNSMPGGVMTGLSVDPAGNLYATLSVTNPGGPTTGIYRIESSGGEAKMFATSSEFRFPNGMHVDGNSLLVTDSMVGAVFRVNLDDGKVTPWVQSAELTLLEGNCGPSAVRLGANGIVKVGNAVYVSNTDRAQIVKIPVNAGGTAGTPEILLGPDCSTLFGLDDLRVTSAGELIYAVNYGNRVELLRPDGSVRLLAQGKPLDGPASLEVLENPRRVLVTNSSFGSFFGGGTPTPSLVTITLE